MLPEFIAMLTKHSMFLYVNHLGKNNTRLTLKQQQLLTSVDHTTNAREPDNNLLKTDESHS